MITLTLLHPLQDIPVQNWTFENEPVIRIGRATDNHVVLYSAVVSRHHVELQYGKQEWKVLSLGTNGTYLDGKRIAQVPIKNGSVIRLARSGPKIKIHIDDDRNNLGSLNSKAQPSGKRKDANSEDLLSQGMSTEQDIPLNLEQAANSSVSPISENLTVVPIEEEQWSTRPDFDRPNTPEQN